MKDPYLDMNAKDIKALFENWLCVVSDHAADDAIVDGAAQSYTEFADYAQSSLEEIIMPTFYEFYLSEFNRRQDEANV